MTTNHPAVSCEELEPLRGVSDTLVHTQETSQPLSDGLNYRTWVISGMLKKVRHAELVYSTVDARDDKKRTSNFRECRSRAWFVRHRHSQEVRVASSRCNLRWCPICIKTKRFVMRQSLVPWVKKAKKPKFVTFTLKHSSAPLSHQISSLYKYFTNLRRRKLWTKKIHSGVWFFQVKKSETDGLWHPHIHVICDGAYISRWRLSEMWEQVTSGSMVVDVRAVKDPKKASDYVSRYATAPCDLEKLNLEDSIEVFDALNGRRICGKFGDCNDLQLVPQKCPDSEEWEFLANFSEVMYQRYDSVWHDNIYQCFRDKKKCPCVPPEPPPDYSTIEDLLVEEPYTKEQLEFEFSNLLD